jgi:hypothetical protein
MKRFMCSAAVLTFMFVLAAPAFAQTPPLDESPGADLGGYVAQSSAMAFSLQPYLPALISTGDVPFEGTIALSTSNVKSGGNSFARGAALWLGSAAGDPGPLIGEGAGQPQIGELFPKWPAQAQATQNDGEVTTGKDPILLMTADGFPDRSVGDTRIADVNVPGLVHIEHVASTSTSLVRDSEVDNDARVVLHGISLINGHITIDELRSYSATTSTGETSTQSGDVSISGLKIGGVTVKVTDKGFQIEGLPPGSQQAPGAGGQPFPNSSPQEAVNAVLNAFHARITLFRSVGSTVGGTADRVGGALVLSIDNPAGGVGPIPPGRFDIILGSTSSTAQATSQFSIGEPSLGGGASVGSTELPRSESPSSVSLGGGPSPTSSTVSTVGSLGGPAAIGGSSVGLQTSDYRFKGVPWVLVLVLLIVALVATRYIRRFMISVIGGNQR